MGDEIGKFAPKEAKDFKMGPETRLKTGEQVLVEMNYDRGDEVAESKVRIMQEVGAEMGIKVNITEARRGKRDKSSERILGHITRDESDESYESSKKRFFGVEIIGDPYRNQDLTKFWDKVKERQAAETEQTNK